MPVTGPWASCLAGNLSDNAVDDSDYQQSDTDIAVHDADYQQSETDNAVDDHQQSDQKKSAAFNRFQAAKSRGRRVSIISIGDDSNGEVSNSNTSNIIHVSSNNDKRNNNCSNDSSEYDSYPSDSSSNSFLSDERKSYIENEGNKNSSKNHNGIKLNRNENIDTKSRKLSSPNNKNNIKLTSAVNIRSNKHEINVSNERKLTKKKRPLKRNAPTSGVRISGEKIVLLNRGSEYDTENFSDISTDEELLNNSKHSVSTSNNSIKGRQENKSQEKLSLSSVKNSVLLDKVSAKHESYGDSSPNNSIEKLENENQKILSNEEYSSSLNADSKNQFSESVNVNLVESSSQEQIMNKNNSYNENYPNNFIIYEEDEQDSDETLENSDNESSSIENDLETETIIPKTNRNFETNIPNKENSSFENDLQTKTIISKTNNDFTQSFKNENPIDFKQHNLAELLRVKSILKRPNSIHDTSTENELLELGNLSTSYENGSNMLTNISGGLNNIKKKSVQFQPASISTELTEDDIDFLDEINCTSHSATVASRNDIEDASYSLYSDLDDIYSRSNSASVDSRIGSSTVDSRISSVTVDSIIGSAAVDSRIGSVAVVSSANVSINSGGNSTSTHLLNDVKKKSKIYFNNVDDLDDFPVELQEKNNSKIVYSKNLKRISNERSPKRISNEQSLKRISKDRRKQDDHFEKESHSFPISADMSVRSAYSEKFDDGTEIRTETRDDRRLNHQMIVDDDRNDSFFKNTFQNQSPISSKYDSNWKQMIEKSSNAKKMANENNNSKLFLKINNKNNSSDEGINSVNRYTPNAANHSTGFSGK